MICTPKSGHLRAHFFSVQLLGITIDMKQQTFTKEQIDGLLRNENVLKFCGTYIAYTPEFKMRAVDQYLHKGMSPKEIFRQAGFDLTLFSKHKPSYLMCDWRKIFKKKGIDGFSTETRGKDGGRPRRFETLSDMEKIKRLELEVRYLKKENDFLVRLRARRAE